MTEVMRLSSSYQINGILKHNHGDKKTLSSGNRPKIGYKRGFKK